MLGDGSQTQNHVRFDYIYKKHPEYISPRRWKADWWLPGAGGRGERGAAA